MTSAYDLPSVQTLGEGGRESEVSPSGEEYAIAEVKFCIFKHLVRFGGKSHDRPAFKREEKTSLSFYINLDNGERARARNKYKLRPIWLEEKHENYIAAAKNGKH